MSRRLARYALAASTLFLIAAVPAGAGAQGYYVAAHGNVDAFTGLANNRNLFGSGGALQQHSFDFMSRADAVTQHACTSIATGFGTYNCLDSDAYVHALISAHVAPGVIQLATESYGLLSPGGTVVDGYGFTVARNGLGAQGTVEVSADWGDHLVFHSSGGGPINVVFTLAVEGSLSVLGDDHPSQDVTQAATYGFLSTPFGTLQSMGGAGGGYYGAPGPFPSGIFQISGMVANGSAYDLHGGLEWLTVADARSRNPEVTSTSSGAYHVYVDVGPDATFESESGERYAQQSTTTTPEPASIALFATGLLGIGARGLRRRRSI